MIFCNKCNKNIMNNIECPGLGCAPSQDWDVVQRGSEKMKAHEKQVGGNHYKDMVIQPYEYIVKNNIGWHEGNAIKRISRWKTKGGKEDIKKAIHELELLLEGLEEHDTS